MILGETDKELLLNDSFESKLNIFWQKCSEKNLIKGDALELVEEKTKLEVDDINRIMCP